MDLLIESLLSKSNTSLHPGVHYLNKRFTKGTPLCIKRARYKRTLFFFHSSFFWNQKIDLVASDSYWWLKCYFHLLNGLERRKCVHTVVAHFAEFNGVVFFCLKKTYNRCLVLINWQHWRLRVDNSVCNHTRDWQIGLPLRGCPILLITRMITGWIGLHSVPLPILIAIMNNTKIPQWSLNVGKPSIDKFWLKFIFTLTII